MASASFAFSGSPAAEKTTITLGSGSDRLSWMKRLTLVVAAAGSGLKDRARRSRPEPSELVEPPEPFCCMRAAGREPQRGGGGGGGVGGGLARATTKAGAVARATPASWETRATKPAQGGSGDFRFQFEKKTMLKIRRIEKDFRKIDRLAFENGPRAVVRHTCYDATVAAHAVITSRDAPWLHQIPKVLNMVVSNRRGCKNKWSNWEISHPSVGQILYLFLPACLVNKYSWNSTI